MLSLRPKTFPYKGCDVPALGWDGDAADVEQAHELWMRVRRARWNQHRWLLDGGSPELYANAAASYGWAAALTHQFYAEMGLSADDAERAIFTARLDADIGADEHETQRRRG